MTATPTPPDRSERPSPQLWLPFLVAAALYTLPSLWLLDNYLQPAFDLGIYDQSLWLIAHGEWFNTLIASHVFGVHFSPILLALSPISLVPGGAVPEIIFQGVVVASGGFPAASLARRFGKSSAWFVAAYALHPAIIGGSWYGFRPWNLAVPVFLWLLAWLVAKPTPSRIFICGAVMLLFREDLAVWVGIAAVILALAGMLEWRSLVLPGLALAVTTGIVLFGVIPELSPVDGYFFAESGGSSGVSASTLVASVVTRAVFVVVPFAVMPSRIRWRLAGPLLIPLAGLLMLGGNALSTAFHYDMMFVPAMLLVLSLSPMAETSWRATAAASATVIVLLGVLRPFPPQDGSNPFRRDRTVTQQLDAVSEAIRSIPDSESLSISGPSNLLPHFSERSNVFIYPEPVDRDRNDQYQGSVVLECPEPNIVVAIAEPTEEWEDALQSSYELTYTTGKASVWLREEASADDPCSAVSG